MALLPILEFPDPRLRKVAAPVAAVTPEIRKLVRDMAETMYAAPGIGLAATQVDVHKRVIVMDVSEARDAASRLHQPRAPARGRARPSTRRGACPVPATTTRSPAPHVIRVRALNENGEPFELDADGMLAVCIQHEMDHLVGKVFVDHLSPLKRARLTARARKKQRLAG